MHKAVSRLLPLSLILFSHNTFAADTGLGQLTLGVSPQKEICHVTAPQKAASQCKNNEIMLFAPETNMDQRKISIMAALVCDFRYVQIVNPSTLVCVFTDIRKDKWAQYGLAPLN